MKIKFFLAIACAGFFILSSCDNKNLFGKFHKAGSSSNVEVLLNDANAALANGDAAEAKQIADKILIQEPNNSEALYVSAAAGLKEAGLDLAGIITNVIVSSNVVGTDLIPKNINLADLSAATENAVKNLKKIADGRADGTIPQNDVDVNLNLGICQVLNAATKIFDLDVDGKFGEDDSDEPIQLTSDFEIKIDTVVLENLKSNTTSQAKAVQQVKDAAIQLIGGAATEKLLGTTTNVTLTDEEKESKGSIDYLDSALKVLDLGTGNDSITDIKSNVDKVTGSTTTAGGDENSVLDIWKKLF